ncbi:hypothetical protein ACFQ3S_06665 [Mucilaginibacter terrae]|uniref:hypothetical protein n=1 Tax=Mucilaginibacter terrae TaxID=1955052 RepID=UPI003625FC85
MNKLLSVLAVFLMLFAASCTKSEMADIVNPDNFISVKQAAIASVNGPTTANVNQEVTFNIAWPYNGDCEKFSSFKTDTLSDTTNIKLFTVTNRLEDCTGKEIKRSKVFKFKPTRSGTYYLKFFGADGLATPIVDTLTVIKPAK